jgi:RNA polymerase sigma factor (sigma-70 family)
MTPLPRNSLQTSAGPFLAELKKADSEGRGEFVYTHQEKFYSIAYMATNSENQASELTILAFQNLFAQLRNLNTKPMNLPLWDWLAMFIVDACSEYHQNYSQPIGNNPRTDPSADGSAQMDWETTIILGPTRVKRCLSQLPEEQQKVFLLRHHFQLNYEQIAAVVNQAPDTVKAWLFRARVQIVKCLGRG